MEVFCQLSSISDICSSGERIYWQKAATRSCCQRASLVWSKVKTVPVIAHPAQGCSSPFAAPAAPRELPGRGAVSQLRLVVGPRHGAGSAELRAALRAHTHGTGRFEAPLPLVHAPREAGAGPRSRAEFCSSSRHRWPRSGVCLRAPNVCLRAARSEHSNKRGMLRNSSLVPC